MARQVCHPARELGGPPFRGVASDKVDYYSPLQEDFEVPDADEVARMETGIKSLTEEVAMLERETKALASSIFGDEYL